MRLVLASASPRRLALLQELGLEPLVRPVSLDELPRPGETARALVLRLAAEKARAGAAGITAPLSAGTAEPRQAPLSQMRADTLREPGAGGAATRGPAPLPIPVASSPPEGRQAAPEGDWLILGADTIVALDGAILGKPADEAHAQAMLERLSGRAHEVLTGLSLVRTGDGRALTESCETRVYFKPLSAEIISVYAASGEPMDKAGAYAIQEGGGGFVERIEGSYTNVVGLPVELLRRMLVSMGTSVEALRAGR
jgi:MAF protein